MLRSALLEPSLSLLIFFARCLLNVARSSLVFFVVGDSLSHAASFLLVADLYSLLRLVGLFFSSRCLIFICLSSPLTLCMLNITRCMLFVIFQTRCSNLSLADCCTQSVDCCPLLVYWNSFLATSSLDFCKVLDVFSTLLAYYISRYIARHTPFCIMLAITLKRSTVFNPHIAFQCSIPVSRCSLLLPSSSVW